MSQAGQQAATHTSIQHPKDKLQPKNDEDLLVLVDDLMEHKRSCEVMVPAGNVNTQLLQGLSDRGFFHTATTSDYDIFERPSGPVFSGHGSQKGGISQEEGVVPSNEGRIEAPTKFSGGQGGGDGDGGKGNEEAQGGVQALLLSTHDEKQLQQVPLEWEAEPRERLQTSFGASFGNPENIKFGAGLLMSAHLSAKGNLCLVLERGHFQVTAADRFSAHVQAVDIFVTADKPYMSQLTIPALENNAEMPLTQALAPRETRQFASIMSTSGEARGEMAVLTWMSGKPVMPVEKGTMRSATLSTQSSLKAAALTERLSDLSIVHLDTPLAPRKLAIHCPKPLLKEMTFRVSVRIRAQFSQQLPETAYDRRTGRANGDFSREYLLEAAKLTVHVNQGSDPEGAPQSAKRLNFLLPTSK